MSESNNIRHCRSRIKQPRVGGLSEGSLSSLFAFVSQIENLVDGTFTVLLSASVLSNEKVKHVQSKSVTISPVITSSPHLS